MVPRVDIQRGIVVVVAAACCNRSVIRAVDADVVHEVRGHRADVAHVLQANETDGWKEGG